MVIPLLFGLLGLALSLAAETKYLATSTLVLDPSGADSSAAAGGSDLKDANVIEAFVATQLKILEDRSILDAAANIVGVDPDDLEGVVTISRVGATTVVSVGAVSADGDLAIRVSNAVGQAYAESRKEAALVALRRASTEISSKLDDLRSELIEISNSTSATAAELRAAESQYSQLFDRAQDLEIELNLRQSGVEVLSEAQLAKDPVSPRPIRNVITMIALGMMAAVGVVAIRHQFDTRLRTNEQIEDITGLSVLATLPIDDTIKDSALPVLEHPFSPFVEALRSLRTSIEFLSMSNPISVLLVTGSTPGEGKSTVALGLASTQAQSGRRVLLISADLRRPTAERALGDDVAEIGLSDLIARMSRPGAALHQGSEEVTLSTVARSTRLAGLWLLPSGTVPPNPNELLSSSAMRQIIAEARDRFDIVVIDTPPLALVADALVLARDVDAVMLVASHGLTRREAIKSASRQMQIAGIRTIGIVANRRRQSESTSYYGYGPAEPATRRFRRRNTEPTPEPVFDEEFIVSVDDSLMHGPAVAVVDDAPDAIAEPARVSANGKPNRKGDGDRRNGGRTHDDAGRDHERSDGSDDWAESDGREPTISTAAALSNHLRRRAEREGLQPVRDQRRRTVPSKAAPEGQSDDRDR